MQAQLFFYDDKNADNYHRSTSLSVLADIRDWNADLFAEMAPDHPVLKIARKASTGGEKLSADEILMFNDFFHAEIVPRAHQLVENLRVEALRLEGHDKYVYEHQIKVLQQNTEKMKEVMNVFMDDFHEKMILTPRVATPSL